jgi:hypothetical protein
MSNAAAKSSFIADTAKETPQAPGTSNAHAEMSDEIFAAVARGDIARVRALLETSPGLKDSRDARGNTPLLIAAREHRTEIGQLLLLKQADPDAQNDIGMTALMFAATNGNALLTETLLEAEADMLLANADDEMADDIARQHGNFALAARIEQRQRLLQQSREQPHCEEEAQLEEKNEHVNALAGTGREDIDAALDSSAGWHVPTRASLSMGFMKGVNRVAGILHLSKFLRPAQQDGAAPKAPAPKNEKSESVLKAPRAAMNNFMRHFRP